MNDQVTPAETETILGLARNCLALEGDFVELGCYRGDTSVLLGKLLRDAPGNECADSRHAVLNLAEIDQTTSALRKPTSRRLWIYDSFAGLPKKTAEDASGAGENFRSGELFVTKREVIDKLRRAQLRNVIVKKAWFNDLTAVDLPEQIAFAFCDGDLYGSIKTSLHLVAPRLMPGGTIVVHDYNNPELPGSSRAVDEFLRNHREYHCSVRYSLAIIRPQC